MYTLFISDLHLSVERAPISKQFFDFLDHTASKAAALYILGDLFDYWAGDDDLGDPLNASVAEGLERLANHAVKVYLMHGNRDLLIGREFAQRCKAELLPDQVLLELHGTRTLVMHGDTLCVDDIAYQEFRAHAHNPDTQAKFLALPLAERRKQILKWRTESETSKQAKTDEIMDGSVAAVESTLREHGYPRLIHGHTHRPARHDHMVDGRTCERWVLNDWYERGGYLRCDTNGCTAVAL